MSKETQRTAGLHNEHHASNACNGCRTRQAEHLPWSARLEKLQLRPASGQGPLSHTSRPGAAASPSLVSAKHSPLWPLTARALQPHPHLRGPVHHDALNHPDAVGLLLEVQHAKEVQDRMGVTHGKDENARQLVTVFVALRVVSSSSMVSDSPDPEVPVLSYLDEHVVTRAHPSESAMNAPGPTAGVI